LRLPEQLDEATTWPEPPQRNASPLLRVESLTTEIPTGDGIIHAVDDVSLTVRSGEAVAIVGESGSGKTMTARSIMRLVPAPGRIVSGSVLLNGRDLVGLSNAALQHIRGAQISIVFQDPMTHLNPLMRVGEQILETIRAHRGTTREAAKAEAIHALELVRMPSPRRVFDSYPHQLSGGMRQRVLIAIAISCRPALLIADEPTTALDVTIQAQIMALLADLRRTVEVGLLLITHDLGVVAEFCDRVYVMYAGRIVEHADVYGLFASPKHPYTAALLRSTLSIGRRQPFEPIEGQPPSLLAPPPGCRFHPRCSFVMDRCRTQEPPLLTVEATRSSRCWLAETNGGA